MQSERENLLSSIHEFINRLSVSAKLSDLLQSKRMERKGNIRKIKLKIS
jgi:hypothetical protein